MTDAAARYRAYISGAPPPWPPWPQSGVSCLAKISGELQPLVTSPVTSRGCGDTSLVIEIIEGHDVMSHVSLNVCRTLDLAD